MHLTNSFTFKFYLQIARKLTKYLNIPTQIHMQLTKQSLKEKIEIEKKINKET